MLLGKNYKIGKTFDTIEIGASLQITENIEDKDLLLYLGLTNDNNPLYIQHEYAALTRYETPVVPTIMLSGIVTSAISKYLPGPGTYIAALELKYPTPMHHYETLNLQLKVTHKKSETQEIIIHVNGQNNEGEVVLIGDATVVPPLKNDGVL